MDRCLGTWPTVLHKVVCQYEMELETPHGKGRPRVQEKAIAAPYFMTRDTLHIYQIFLSD